MWGVFVFGLLTVREHAPAETNYCPICVTYREHNSIPEEVDCSASLTWAPEPCCFELFNCYSKVRSKRVPLVGCVADSELLNCFGVESSAPEVGADFAGLFSGAEGLVVEVCGLFEQFADFLSFFSVRSICGVGVAEGYAESVS